MDEMAKDAYWFKHDANARHDPKILILRARFGEAGYSRYFMVVEMMREAHGYKLKVDDYIYSIIGLDLGIPPDEAKRFVDSCVEIGLFFKDDFLYSTSLLRRMEEKDRLSDIRKQNASKRGSKTEANDIAKPKQNDPIRIEENRIEENRVDENRKPMRVEDVQIPEHISRDAWQGFLDMRKSIKKPLTARAAILTLAKLDKFKSEGHNPNDLLNLAVMNSWQGVYLPTNNGPKVTSKGCAPIPGKYDGIGEKV